jgi:HK97 family phage major capsid protein
MDKLRELQQRFNGLVKQLRDAQAEENPDAAKVDAIEKELRALAQSIETEQAILRTQDGTDGTDRKGGIPAPGGEEKQDEEELRAAILRYMRTGDTSELRAMSTGTTGGATGGYLIPDSWAKDIIAKAREQFVMRQICSVETSATDRNFPVEVSYGASSWLGEGAAYPESDATFAKAVIGAHKCGRTVKVSEELLQDEQYDLVGYLTRAFGYSNGLAEETAFISGTGTGQPKGFLLDADSVPAGKADISFDDFLSLYGELKSGYDPGARWLMGKSTLVAAMKLKDDNKQYIFHPSSLPGELGNILGKPVSLSSFMPAIDYLSKPLAFGDFRYYRIQDRTGFSIQRLVELYANNGQVGFRGFHRVDGKLLVPEAIKVLAMPAAPPPPSGGGS